MFEIDQTVVRPSVPVTARTVAVVDVVAGFAEEHVVVVVVGVPVVAVDLDLIVAVVADAVEVL